MALERVRSNNITIDGFEKVSDVIKHACEKLGAKFDGPSKNANYRGYTNDRGYIAITRAEQEASGPYSGLSFAIFPIWEADGHYTCIVTICIGTNDLGEDEELSALPWFRRSYTKLNDDLHSQGKFFIKTSFSDAMSELTPMIEKLDSMERENKSNLTIIKDYYKCITAAIIVDIQASDSDENAVDKYIKNIDKPKDSVSHGMQVLLAWLAQYGKIRGWEAGKRGVYDLQDKFIRNIKKNSKKTEANLMREICEILPDAKYIVIQGAPGTGKTRMANKIASEGFSADKINVKFEKPPYFTQLHAETTYSDFVGGIRPVLFESAESKESKENPKSSQNQFQFEYKEGILTKIIKEALDNKDKNYLLIIDEINRANLKNVLGPVFYLFERPVGSDSVNRAEIEIETADRGTIKLSALPSNIYVIATMNTSDRSLAMVDFALRRRFSWYTLYPYDLSETLADKFHIVLFNKISELFDKYATDEELPLQPGHSYFIAKDEKEMKYRLTYEIMPLMKEYFAAGLMLRARDEFAAIYYEHTGKFMYR